MTNRIWRNLVYAIPTCGAFVDVVVSIAKVDGRSMQPTLNPNPMEQDFILLNKWSRFNVSKGDIVVLISPKDPEMRLVKRVIAVEGNIVKMRDKDDVVTIPDGYIWVEGDHINQSLDSNSFGAIPLGLVTAKVMCIIWPLNRIQSLKNKVPNKN